MHTSVKNLTYIENKIKKVTNNFPIIIAVSKNFSEENITPLLDFGHKHFGENKDQECVKKWHELNPSVRSGGTRGATVGRARLRKKAPEKRTRLTFLVHFTLLLTCGLDLRSKPCGANCL